MDATLNRGDWKAMENSWAKALDNGKNSGCENRAYI